MPAAYVEIIKYALGAQVGALTTLRGLLYTTEEAEKLGFFHEVVEPEHLLATSIRMGEVHPVRLQHCLRDV